MLMIRNYVIVLKVPEIFKLHKMSTLTFILRKRVRSYGLRYITYIIPKFSDAYKMGRKEGYLYLKKYGGLDFLFEHWWALHTDSPFWAVRSLYNICYQNGGMK